MLRLLITASDVVRASSDWRRRERRDYRSRPTVSAIIPTLNEAKNLPHVLKQLPQGINELIIVDGHSIDDTDRGGAGAAARRAHRLQDRKGKGNALACGFAAAPATSSS